MRKITILFILALAPLLSIAQENPRNNLIKVNTFAIVFKITSISYERSLNDRFSVSLGVGLKNKGSLPSIFHLDKSKFFVSSSNLNGFAITPEFRWYLKRCAGDPPMEGFYLSGYFRYSQFRYKAGIAYENQGNIFDNRLEATLRESGVGALLGYQVRIKKWLVADFLIFGPRISNYTLDIEFEQQLSGEFIQDFKQNVREVIDRFFMNNHFDLTNTQYRFKGSKSLFNLRYGIALGVAF